MTLSRRAPSALRGLAVRRGLFALPLLLAALLSVSAPATAAPSTSAQPPLDEGAACAAFAKERLAADTDWACLGPGLTSSKKGVAGVEVRFTDTRSGRSVDVTGLPEQAAQTAAEALLAQHRKPLAQLRTKPSTAPLTSRAGRGARANVIVDSYHATSNEYVYWNINNRPGKMRFTYTIGLHNHSGDVYMQYFETTGAPILVQWRLRLRQDFNLADDITLFTYPLVQGSINYVQSYTEHESRYGDGYNQMPYVTGARVFWDSYSLSLRYAGTLVRPYGTLQSDRATCYKTTNCKFI